MFGHLYNVIIPYVAEFFSKLIGLTTISVGDFINAIAVTGVIPYTDLLTGVASSYTIFGVWTPIQPTLASIVAIMFGAVPHSVPLWVGMLLCCIQVYFLVAIVKFVNGLF